MSDRSQWSYMTAYVVQKRPNLANKYVIDMIINNIYVVCSSRNPFNQVQFKKKTYVPKLWSWKRVNITSIIHPQKKISVPAYRSSKTFSEISRVLTKAKKRGCRKLLVKIVAYCYCKKHRFTGFNWCLE